jgi:hypothetical protein
MAVRAAAAETARVDTSTPIDIASFSSISVGAVGVGR